MARILGIGIATLDIINIVDGYPPEDSEVRAVAQRVARGGNCANTLTILARIGHRCDFGGVLAEEPDTQRILDDLTRHGIGLHAVRREARGKVPTSYILLNQRNGSRSIVHYRDLPEFAFEDFAAIDLSPYDWLHFEGRNVEETRRMLAHARAIRPDLPRSVEIEKPRADIESLYSGASLLLFSRHYAQITGHTRPQDFLAAARILAPHADIALAWGEQGAWGMTRAGEFHHSPAFPPPRVVDTLGAGDVFNAGMIDALLREQSLEESLRHACILAGRKCGYPGLDFPP